MVRSTLVLSAERAGREGGTSAFADDLAGYVADEIATGVAEGHSRAYVACMRRELTGLLMLTGLAKER